MNGNMLSNPETTSTTPESGDKKYKYWEWVTKRIGDLESEIPNAAPGEVERLQAELDELREVKVKLDNEGFKIVESTNSSDKDTEKTN